MVNYFPTWENLLLLLICFDSSSFLKAKSVYDVPISKLFNDEADISGTIKKLNYEDKIKFHKFLKTLNELKNMKKESQLQSKESVEEGVRRNWNENFSFTNNNLNKFHPEEDKNQHKHEENSLNDHWAEHEHSQSLKV